jgi:hypothetical protein
VTRQAPRAIAIALGVVVALVGWPQSGVAQERGRTASPDELWREYPLQPDANAGGAGAREESVPDGAEPRRAQPAVEQSNDAPAPSHDGSGDRGIGAVTIVLVAVLAVAILALLAVLVPFDVRERLRRSRGGSSPPDRPVAPPRSGRPEPRTWAALRSSAWTAEIQWRCDGAASRFCVVASPPGGDDEVTLAESSHLEWPPRSDAAVDALVSAVADLERSVVAEGWETTSPGTSWFGRRFVWPRTSAPEQAKAVQRA